MDVRKNGSLAVSHSTRAMHAVTGGNRHPKHGNPTSARQALGAQSLPWRFPRLSDQMAHPASRQPVVECRTGTVRPTLGFLIDPSCVNSFIPEDMEPRPTSFWTPDWGFDARSSSRRRGLRRYHVWHMPPWWRFGRPIPCLQFGWEGTHGPPPGFPPLACPPL